MKEKSINILEFENIAHYYNRDKNVISNCSFKVKEGSICAIFGESGSGKSTLLRLIAGLERPYKGNIKINEEIVSSSEMIVPPQKRGVGLVFQDYALFPHLTVKENIAFWIKDNKNKTVEDLLEKVKMEGFENKYPNELSGGQQQRIAIARTLANNTKLLLLDEPFSNLDDELKTDLRKEIKKLVNQINTTLLFIKHDILDAIDIADEIIFIESGEIIKHNSIKNIFKDNDHQYIDSTKNNLKIKGELIKKIIG